MEGGREKESIIPNGASLRVAECETWRETEIYDHRVCVAETMHELNCEDGPPHEGQCSTPEVQQYTADMPPSCPVQKSFGRRHLLFTIVLQARGENMNISYLRVGVNYSDNPHLQAKLIMLIE